MRKRSLLEQELKNKLKLLRRTLREIGESRAVVLVEGKKDREALERIGVKNNIVLVGMGARAACEKIAGADEAVVLADFDERGEEIAREVEEALWACNIRPNLEHRRRLRYILGVRNFEEIGGKLEEFEKKCKENKIEI
ncbi:MAG: toprim domain-containing protein [Candidatus Micrarchaeota archaeon]